MLNSELAGLLVDVGRRMALGVKTEFAGSGGRLDVVWTWTPPSPIPGLEGSLPVVGFEVESSWRSGEHVKGDWSNQQDAAVALGVIAVAGADLKEESLHRFTASLVDRPGIRVRVWTEEDVRALAAGEPSPSTVARAAESASAASAVTVAPAIATRAEGGVAEHPGWYPPLWLWLQARPRCARRVSFDELGPAIGMALPDWCRNHAAHWYGDQGHGRSGDHRFRWGRQRSRLVDGVGRVEARVAPSRPS